MISQVSDIGPSWSSCFCFCECFQGSFLLESVHLHYSSLRKHAYSNILNILPPKNFQMKNSDIFHISARGGSNEYPQFMLLSRNKKTNVYPCKPQFYYIKMGFKGGQNNIGMFS